MIGLNKLGYNFGINDQNSEKKAQRINTIGTGLTVAGLAGSAVAAGVVTKYAKSEGNVLAKGYEAAASLLSKATAPLMEKLSPKLATLQEKAVSTLTNLQSKIDGNALCQKLAKVGSSIAEKGQTAIGAVKKFAVENPKSTKIAALAVVLLAVDHIYRKGQINGLFAAQSEPKK